jgi:hypothetical protein
MALMQCHECEGKVSSEASTCPHCGAPVKKPPPKWLTEPPPPDPRKTKTGKINVSDEEWAQMRAQADAGRRRQAMGYLSDVSCPACKSRSVKKIGKLNKVGAAGIFGIFSIGHLTKTFKCHKCGYTW